jgi:hypothetical protein
MRRLCEVGVPAEKNRLKSCRAAKRDDLVKLLRRAFSGWAIAWPVHDSQYLTGVGQGNDEGEIAPVSLVRDVHAFLAFTSRLDDRAVGIDLSLREETSRLPLPNLQPRLIEGSVESGDVRQTKSPTEIARGGGVGNSLGAQGIEVCLVLTAVLDVFQAPAVAEGIESDIEDVIRLVVGQVHKKHLEVTIDGVDQAGFARELIHQADAAVVGSHRAVGQLVMDVDRPHDGPITFGKVVPVQALLDACLAILRPLSENRKTHSKTLRASTGMWNDHIQIPRKPREIFEVFQIFPEKVSPHMLVKGLVCAV